MQASMSEVVLPLDGRDDEELRHSTEMDQIGSSCRDESQLSSQIDDETLEDVDIVIDHALVQYFGTTLPSVTQNEHQPSPPPRIARDEVPVQQELSKTSEPKSFSIDIVEPNLVSIDRYGSAIDSNWDETETDFNYYLPNYAQEVVITTENNSPQAPDKEPSERIVTAPNDYSLDVIVPEKLGVQAFPFEEALNPLTAPPNPNPLQEESAFFDEMDLNPAGLKDCRSFYEAQTTELSAEGSPENVSPGCSGMHIVPMSDGMIEVGTRSPPEQLVGSVGLDVVGKNVIVEMNPTASPDVARVPCSNPVCQPLSPPPPPSYRQTMAAAYQKTVYDPLSCCGPYGNVVKNKIVLSYSGEGVMSENDSRDSDYGPPKLDAIDETHASTNDQPNDYPPMLEPADPAFSSAGKVAAHVIPSAAGEALESIKKLSLGVVPENSQELLEASSQDELNVCLGKLVPSITPEFSKEIPSSYIVNDMYNVRNITPESSTIASCVEDVRGLPDLLPVSEEPKSYRTFNRANSKKKKPECTESSGTCYSQTKSVGKVPSSSLIEPANKLEGLSRCHVPESGNKFLSQNSIGVQASNQNALIIGKKEPSTSTLGVDKIGPVTRVVKVAKSIPQQALSALMHDGGAGRANFKIIPTTATTINLGVKKLTIVKPQNMKDKIVLLKPATVKKILASDFESMSNLKKLTSVQSSNLEKMLLSQAMPDPTRIVKPVESLSLPTSSLSSSSVILKESKGDLSPTVKGTSKVAISKNSVALKVSLPLDLLSVKTSLIPDAVKTVACDKDDEHIEKAVTADGDVDPNAIMDEMKVSVPYLFPVTKPEVTKVTKTEVGKIEQSPSMAKEKKKSAAAPVVVKMTSKANRRIFSPIRDIDFSVEKPKSVSVKTSDSHNMKSVLKGNSDNLMLSKRQSTSDVIVDSADVLFSGNTITAKEEPAVCTDRSKGTTGQPVSTAPVKKVFEPSLMKQVDNASDDLSSFLSSLSGPKGRPKSVENLEKGVYATIKGASACNVDVKPFPSTKTAPAEDPIIIPPAAFRNDDPLSLKVGLKPCKFRDVRKDEPSKKHLFSQGTRSAPTSSRSNTFPSNKPTALLPASRNSMDSRPAIFNSENAVLPVEGSTSMNKGGTQIESEERVHPIVELVNQLIESNSKSPQIFGEPDRTRSEVSQVAKKEDDARAVQEKTDAKKTQARNEEVRANEDGILAGVVKERTSKLIQKARDLVCNEVRVDSNHRKAHSSKKSPIAEESVRPLKIGAPEEPSHQVHTKNDTFVSTVKTAVDEKEIQVDGSLEKAVLPAKVPFTDKVVEQKGEAITKIIRNLTIKKTVASVISNGSTDGAEAHKCKESRSSLPIVLSDKNLPSEGDVMGPTKAATPVTIPSNRKDLADVSEGKVPSKFENVKTEDLKCSPKATDVSESAPPSLSEKSEKPQDLTVSKQTSANRLKSTDLSSVTKTLEDVKGSEGKEVTRKTADLFKKGSETKVPEESVKSKDLTCPPKATEKMDKPQNQTVPEQGVNYRLQATYVSIAKRNTAEDFKGSEKMEISPKTTDFPRRAATVNGKPPTLQEVPAVRKSITDKPQTDANIAVSTELEEDPGRYVKTSNRLQAVTGVPVGKASEESKVDEVKFCLKTLNLSNKTPTNTCDSNQSCDLINDRLQAAEPISAEEASEKKVLSIVAKSTSNQSKPFPAEKGQSLSKTGSSVSTDGVHKEIKIKKEEGREVPQKTKGSSKKVTPSNDKLPTQLIVSIPTVAISHQQRTLDVRIPANGTLAESKTETGQCTSTTVHTSNSSKPPSRKGDFKQIEVPLSETKHKQIVASDDVNEGKISFVEESSAKEFEKVLSVRDSLPSPKTYPAVDVRMLTRHKSRSEVPIATSDESKGKELEDAKELLETGGSLVKCPEKSIEKLLVSNPSEKVDRLPVKHDTSSPLLGSQNSRDNLTEDTNGAVETVIENEKRSLEKPVRLQTGPEKTSQRMRTRGSVPIPTICGKDKLKVEVSLESDKVLGTAVSPENGGLKPDTLLKQSKIPTNDKPTSRPRTRSETSHEKKMFDDGCTENLEPVVFVTENEQDHTNLKSSVKKPRGENIAASTVPLSATEPFPLTPPKVAEHRKEGNDLPNPNVRTRGKIERKPATVKPIPVAPKKGCSKFLGNPQLMDDFDELEHFPSLSNKKLESNESAEGIAEIRGGCDVKTMMKTPISTRRSSSQKNNALGNPETNSNNHVEPLKSVLTVQKSVSKRLCRDNKWLTPKKNLRVSMKPKKVSKLKNDLKNRVNDVYDFTDDEDQSIKMQTIDHYRKVSGKSTKTAKRSIARFESQESLLSDDENGKTNKTRMGRNATLKSIAGKTRRRTSPRKSMSEPRKSESKKGVGMELKSVSSESTDSLLSNSSETVLPAELQENLRNSRNESIRLAKEKQLKKSPVRKLSTSADSEECASQSSSTRETQRSLGSRASSAENPSTTDKNGRKELENVMGSNNRTVVGREEGKATVEISTRETRRSSGSSAPQVSEACKTDLGKKEIAKEVAADRNRRSPMKRDLNVTDKLSRKKISEHATEILNLESVNSVNEFCSKPNSDSLCRISTRSKSRDSANEDDISSPRALRNKGILQTSPIDGSEQKVPKSVDTKSAMKCSQDLKVWHKIDKNIHSVQMSGILKSDSSNHEHGSVKSLTRETGETIIDQASSIRMVTRSSGAPSSKTTENEVTENSSPKSNSTSDEGKFLPKLRSSANKKVEVFRKTDCEPVDVPNPTKLGVHTNEKISEILSNKVECVSRPIALNKLKKPKKTDTLLFPGCKDNQFPVDRLLQAVSKPVTIASSDAAGKEKQRRAKKGGMADGVNDMILSQLPLLTQDIAGRNAEAVSLKTPPMDSTAAQELDNIQPVGAISQHGEPEGAKSSTRTAQLRSLVGPLDEASTSNSVGFFHKKNKKLVVEKKKLAQSPPVSDNKQIDGKFITGKANDSATKSSNKRLGVNSLVPPGKFETHTNHVNNEAVSNPSFSLTGSSSCQSKGGESSKTGNHTDDVFSNPDQEVKSTRRITRSSLSSSSPNFDLKTPSSASRGEQQCVPLNENRLNSSTPNLASTENEPCTSKLMEHTCCEEGPKPTLPRSNPSDPVTEKLSESGLRSEGRDVQISLDTQLLKPLSFGEGPGNETSKTFRSKRGRKPKDVLTHCDLPSGDDGMKFAQPKPLKLEKEKGTLVEVIALDSPSGEDLPNLEVNMTEGKSDTSANKDLLPKPPNPHFTLPNMGRVKTNTKDVCEISGEAEKLFEEASLDGREGFDVIVPSPGKSPDSTTQHSSEVMIPVLSSELEDLSNAKISEDAHGVTSTTELGDLLNDTERKMLVSSQDFEVTESCTKREDENVSSTTVDSTKILETIEVESSPEHLIPLKEDALSSKPSTVDEKSNCVSNTKFVAKRSSVSGKTINLIPEHPKKIWRVNPVLGVSSTPAEITPKIVGFLENGVCCVVKPHISDEELKKTPLKKRQVWAYSSACNTNGDAKYKLVSNSSVTVEDDPTVIHSTNDVSPSTEIPKSLPVAVGPSNISPEKEATKKSNEIVCTGKADGSRSPTSLVDRLPHSICNILATPTDKQVANESTAETLPQGAECFGSDLSSTRNKSREALLVRRQINERRRIGIPLRSTRNRWIGKRHLLARNRRVAGIGRRYKIVHKTETNRKKLKLSPSPATEKTKPTEDVKPVRSAEGQVNQGGKFSKSENLHEVAHTTGKRNMVDSSNISSVRTNNSLHHTATETDDSIVAPSVPKPNKRVEPAKQPEKVPSPFSNDKCAELIVDTTDKEIDDEESPPFSPIGVDTAKQSDWNLHSGSTTVEHKVPFERSSPAQLSSTFSKGFHGAPLDVPLEDVTYRRTHKMERIRSYSNDEPDRSLISSKPRTRRKSHPVENIPVDLSRHVKPVFGMKIPPNLPKLDLTGRTPVYQDALDQPPIPYDMISTTFVRPISTPPPSFVPPHRPVVVHSMKVNGPIRPIPTLRVASPIAPYAPVAGHFSPTDEMAIELSSRMSANYPMSAFRSTKKKPHNTNFTGPKKVDYNPLLLARENNYILNAGLSSVVPSLPSVSTFSNSPSSLAKRKSGSARGRTDISASNVTPSASKSGVMNVGATVVDSAELTTSDARLHEAQVQLLMTNPELSVSRTASSRNGPSSISGNSTRSSEVKPFDEKHSEASSGSISSLKFKNGCLENQRVEVTIEEIIEPLDVVTCELDEGSADSFAHTSQTNVSDFTITPSITVMQHASKNMQALTDIKNEPKNVPVTMEKAHSKDVVKSVRESVTPDHYASKKKPLENQPGKTTFTPRRRISILDAHKSYKKSTPTAVVTTVGGFSVHNAINEIPSPLSIIPSEPEEHGLDSTTTKAVEQSNLVHSVNSKCNGASLKNISLHGRENKAGPSCFETISPISSGVEPKLGLVSKLEPTSYVKPGGTLPKKGSGSTMENQGPVTKVSSESYCIEEEMGKSVVPEPFLPIKTIPNYEVDKSDTSPKPNVISSKIIMSELGSAVDSAGKQEQEKVEPTGPGLGHEGKPEKGVSSEIISRKCTDLVDGKLAKPISQQFTVGKLKEAKQQTETSKLANSHDHLKTNKISYPSSEPLADRKQSEAAVGQMTGVDEKSVPKQKTDVSKFTQHHTKLETGPARPCSELSTDGKLSKASVEQRHRIVEKSVPIIESDASELTNALSQVKTDDKPRAEVEKCNAKSDIHVKRGNYSVTDSEFRTNELSVSDVELAGDVEKSVLKPKSEEKRERANVELTAKVVEKPIPEIEADMNLRMDRVEKSEPSMDGRRSSLDNCIESPVAIANPTASDHLYCVKIDKIPQTTISGPKADDKKSIAVEKYIVRDSESTSYTKADDKLDVPDKLTTLITKLGAAEVVLNEQRAIDETESNNRMSVCTDKPSTEFPLKLAEQPKVDETVTPQAAVTGIRMEKGFDSSTKVESDRDAPSNDQLDLKLPSSDSNSEKTKVMPPLGPLPPKELEIEKCAVFVPCDKEVLEPPAIEDPAQGTSREFVAEYSLSLSQHTVETKPNACTDTESKLYGEKELITFDDTARKNKSEDRNSVKSNYPQSPGPAKQSGGIIENICCAIVVPTVEKEVDELISSSPDEPEEVKNKTADSAADVHVEQENKEKDVSDSETFVGEGDGKHSVGAKCLELKVAEKPLIIAKISECQGVKEVSRFVDKDPKNSRAPEDSNIMKSNDPPLAVTSKQIEETVEAICSATTETAVHKEGEELFSDKSVSMYGEEPEEVKNKTIDSAALLNVEKDVSHLETIHGKDGGLHLADVEPSEQKVTDKLVISSEMFECAEEQDDRVSSMSGCDIVTTDVTASSETSEAVTSSSAGGQTESQVADFPSIDPPSCENPFSEGKLIPTSPCLDAVEEDPSKVVGKSSCGVDEIRSPGTNNSEDGTSLPGPYAVEILATPPGPSATKEESHPSFIVSPSSPLECTGVGTPPQSAANMTSAEPENATGSCIVKQEGVLSDSFSEPLVNSVSTSVYKTDEIDLSEISSSCSHIKRKSNDEDSLTSSCDDSPPKPSHPDNQAVGNTDSCSPKSASTEEGDKTEMREPTSQTLPVDTVEKVPNSNSETRAIVQSTESSLSQPSDSTKGADMTGSAPGCESGMNGLVNILIARPERKRKRPAWWSLEGGAVASKLNKANTSEEPFEVDYPGEYGEKIKIDPSVPKVEVELLCQAVIRKLQENLSVSIDHIDLAKLQKCWAEFHSSISRGTQEERSNQPNIARKSAAERLSAVDIRARPGTSRGSDHDATIQTNGSRSLMEKEVNEKPSRLVAILHERRRLAKKSLLEPPTKRGEKRTVSQAFAQNVYIYKDPRVTGRSTYDRTAGSGRRQLLPYEIPVPPSSPLTRQPPQISYSWILEHLRERRKRNQHRESNTAVQPCKDFMRPQEEYTRPSLREVYNRFAGEHAAHMVGYSRVSAAHEVPLPASTPSSSTSRIPTFTISSDSEDSNPGNPEDSVSERDEVRRRIRRKSNTPSISSCSCPQSGHESNRTTCLSCRKESYHVPGAFSPVRSSRPPLYTKISHVEPQESARVRGKRAATVGGGDDPVTVLDSEAAVRRLKSLISTAWPSDLDTLNDDPPIRDSFRTCQEDASLPHVTVSPYPPPQSSSSAHPPPETEQVAGATFQRCLQQKPFSERGRRENSSDNVQLGSVFSSERPVMSLLSQTGIPAGQQSCFPCYDGPPAKKKKS